MGIWIPNCGLVHDVTEEAAEIEVVAPDEVSEFIAAHGGRIFVWISVHRAWLAPLCLLDVSLELPAGDIGFRRIAGPGFDVYLESTQHTWPKVLEFALIRHKRVEAYWNGLAWIA